MNTDFPHDETGELLRLMAEQGDDLSLPRDVDFYLLFDTQELADAFASEADLGPELSVQTSRYENTEKWQACITVRMVPVYAELVSFEKHLAQLGRQYRGAADGWGCPPAR